MITRRHIQSWSTSVYSRITLTRITTFFFIFSLLHCLIQGIIHSFLHATDYDQRVFLTAITRAGGIPSSNITFLQGSAGNLRLEMCNDIPHGLFDQDVRPCVTVFDSVQTPKTTQLSRTFDWRHGVDFIKVKEPAGAVLLQSRVSSDRKFLTRECVQTLVEAQQRVTNARREDIAFIFLQFWLFGISVFAIVQDSVPHILTAVASRVLATAWSIYAIWRTKHHADAYEEVYSNPGTPCSLDIFSEYFRTRIAVQIADTVVSVIALCVAFYLSFKLLKTFGSQSFKCVGAPAHVQRINKFFLALLACLQLEVFILVTGMSMWIDVLLNTAIAKISSHTPAYIACFTISAVVLVPWIVMGWYAIKREKRKLTIAFLLIAFIIITGWSIMFYSIVYRWTFVEWPFLGVFTVASLALLLTSIVLGVVCRVNFGKGHAEYLRAESALASQNFTKEIFSRDEKKDDKFDLAEPPKIYYVQTRETLADIDFRSISSDGGIDKYGLPRLEKMGGTPAGPFQSA